MERLFKKYIHSVLTPGEFSEIADVMGQDKYTDSVLRWMKSRWNHFADDPDAVKSNPLLWQKIQKIIFAGENVRLQRKLKLYTAAFRVAAIVIFGLLLAGAWFYYHTEKVNKEVFFQTVNTPFGARTQFNLPDGSAVWLNSGSTLTYSANFSKQRQVELQGEAFFDVVKAKAPFVVNTVYGHVSVLGTAFNVQVYPDEEFAVTLERGSVSYTGKEEEQKQVLIPGEQLRIRNGKFVKRRVDPHLFTSWKDGKLVFQREPFPAMIGQLERWYNVKITYSADDFYNLWFTGTVSDETLTEVLEMVCKAAPVNYSYNSQGRIVRITVRKE
jgi:transmembrane sensor